MTRDGGSDATPSGRRPLDEIALWGQQDPAAAIEYLTACLDGTHGTVEPDGKAAYWLLLAELHSVLGDLTIAIVRCGQAVAEVKQLATPETPLVLAALAVEADLAVQAADGNAPTLCFAYMRETAHQQAAGVEPSRLLVAGALMAVAEYHHQDCATAKTRLDKLTKSCPDGPLGRALAAAALAMDEGCAQPAARVRGTVRPLPGVILNSHADRPDEDALAERVRLHRGVHRRHVRSSPFDPSSRRWQL